MRKAMYDFDLFVIGAGSGGVRAARMAAGYGAKVAIAEDKYMGGTCVNVGCVPKKLYTYAAHYRYECQDSRGFGWSSDLPAFDWPILRDNKKREISRLNGIYDNLLEGSGVTVFNGRASITAANTLTIGDSTVTARYILIATGGWPFVPDLPGRELAVTSNEIFDLESFPDRILVVGGGYIAVEFAGIFAGLGAEVTLSYRGPEVLRHFDRDLRQKFMHEASRHLNLELESQISSITRNAEGSLDCIFSNGSALTVDTVLFATGRKPNTSNLGLENTAISLTRNGSIPVDKNYQTAEPSIFAIGDVVGHMALTPVALAEGMVVADHLFGAGERTMSYDNIPTAIFSHPNLSTVGLSEETARERYDDIVIYESDFRHLRHTLSGNPERTYMKVVVDQQTDRVLGMHMMGADAGEVIQGFAVAMNCGLTKKQLDATIGIHPTAAEEFVTMRSRAR